MIRSGCTSPPTVPKSQALTAKLNAGWKSFVSDVPGAMTALEGMQQSWKAAGRSAGDLYATAWACGCVLADGEPADSPRAVAQAGPRAAVLLHRAADLDMEGWQNTSPVPPSVKEQVDGYVAMARGFEPPDARYLNNHRGHFVFVKPEERKFVTADLIRRTTFTATEQELKQRVEALAQRRLEPVGHPDHPGRGARHRGLGADQARVRLIACKNFRALRVALPSRRNPGVSWRPASADHRGKHSLATAQERPPTAPTPPRFR